MDKIHWPEKAGGLGGHLELLQPQGVWCRQESFPAQLTLPQPTLGAGASS